MTFLLGGVAAAGWVVYTVLLTLYRAIYLMLLWGLFAVPLGLPELSLAHAAGLLLIVGAARPRAGQTFLDAERDRQMDETWVKAHVMALIPRPEADADLQAAVRAAQLARTKQRFLHAAKNVASLNFLFYPLLLAIAYVLHWLM